MRNYGLYDATRGLTTLVAAGVAGVLLWVATLVGVGSVTHYWEALGIVAGAGLVLALSQVAGGWTKGHGVRLSPTTFVAAFLPVLVCVGWILMATQPGNGWYEGTITSWSRSIGISGLVHALGLWHGVLAFGFGLTLGLTVDTVPAPVAAAAPAPVGAVRDGETVAADGRGPAHRQRPAAPADADEPLTAERDAAHSAEPHTVTVGPRATSSVEE